MTDLFYVGVAAALGFVIGILTMILIARGCGIWFAPFSKWSSASGQYLKMTRIYSVGYCGWYPLVRVGLRYWVRAHELRHALAEDIRQLRDDHDPSFYNGVEMALALVEQRSPDLRGKGE